MRFVGLFLAFVLPVAANALEIAYESRTGSSESREVWLVETKEGCLVYTAFSGRETWVVMCDSTLSTVEWRLAAASEDTDVVAARSGTSIVVRGRLKGRQVSLRHQVDAAEPWYQGFGLALGGLASTDLERSSFVMLRPDDLSLQELSATRVGAEAVTVGDRSVEAVRYRVSFSGFAGLFWSADVWFSDTLWLEYRGANGGPFSPVTEIRLSEASLAAWRRECEP